MGLKYEPSSEMLKLLPFGALKVLFIQVPSPPPSSLCFVTLKPRVE